MSTLAPCGTRQARRRHKRNNETCQTCDAALKPRGNKPAPCGTSPARQRHHRRGETCQVCGPITPVRPPKPCGTPAAVKRHRYRGEPVCDTCKQGERARTSAASQAKGTKRLTNAEFIEELTFLINAGEGQHRILTALGYQNKPDALHQRLYRAKRHDLTAQIFGWDLAA